MKGFIWTEVDQNIFISLSKYLIIGVYIDDLFIIVKSQKDINYFKKSSITRFKMTDLRLVTHYLKLRIIGNISASTIFFS